MSNLHGSDYYSGEYVERPRTMKAFFRKWETFNERLEDAIRRDDPESPSPKAIQQALCDEVLTDLSFALYGTDGHGGPRRWADVRPLGRRVLHIRGQMTLPPAKTWKQPALSGAA